MKNTIVASAAAVLCLFASPGFGSEAVWLSELDLSPIVQGWGKPQADKSVTGKPLSIGGKTFAHALGTHADSVVRLQLKGGAQQFSAAVGVDDAAGNSRASVIFKVVGDGKTLFKTGVMKLGTPSQTVNVDVRNVQMLLLVADSAGDGVTSDHADWADAKIEVLGAKPAIVGPPPEEKVVLTPKPPRSPRINGVRIFGVRPGHPLLFTIPATGDRPMKFAARNLPAGLSLNAESGQITGQIEKPGTYVVSLRASNKWGISKRDFKIVCGDTLA